MKIKKRKVVSMCLAALVGFQCLIPSSAFAAKTAHVEHIVIKGSKIFNDKEAGMQGCKITVGKDNPQIGFCVQPGVKLHNGTHNAIKPESIGISDKKMKRLSLIAYYGYKSQKDKTNTNFCLTQSLIWKELGSPRRLGYGSYMSEKAMKPWFDKIMNKVNNFQKVPSFSGSTIRANVNETKSIEDKNKVLVGLKIKSVTGGKATKDGNTLKITPDGSSKSMKITFDRSLPASQNKTNFVYRQGNKQAVSTLTYKNVYEADLDVKVIQNGTAEVTKKSESGKFIKGAKFDLIKDGKVISSSTTSEKGKALFTNLKPGKYSVKEIFVPKPYLIDSSVKKINVKENDTAEVTFTNKMPTGKFELKKTREDGKILEGAKFRIWSDGNDLEGNKIDFDKTFTTNERGLINISNLKLGEYKYQEIEAPKGYLLDNKVRTFTLSYENNKTSIVTSTGSVVNKMPRGEFELVKEGTDKSKLKGAQYKIWSVGKDLEGNEIGFDKVFTTDENGRISVKDLKLGKYKFKEVKAPKGYVLDESVGEFTLDYKDQNTAVIKTSVNRTDKKVTVKKTDVADKNVVGAKLKVTDKEGKVVDSWTVKEGEKEHLVNNLVEGETYTLHEEYAAEGYVVSKPVKFTVSKDKVDQSVKMVDIQVEFIKEDTKGNLVSGMEYTVTNVKTNKVVDKGVTNKEKSNFLNNLVAGETYIIEEIKAPNGYVKTAPIEFTVTEELENQKIIMVNKKVTVEKKDIDENNVVGAKLKVIDKEGKVVDSWTVKEDEEKHVVNNLVEGETYTLHEEYAAEGYVVSKPVKFTVNKDKVDQSVKMIDIQVEFSKEDTEGNLLGEMEYTVTNTKTKNIVDKGVTNKEKSNFLNNLVAGETYVIEETKVPNGYVKAAPIEFTVTEELENQKITMINKKVTVEKKDIDENNIVGAKLKVTDEKGKVVDSWTTQKGEKAHIVIGLSENNKYILTEESAPNGYVISKEIKFDVNGEKEDLNITMTDKKVKFEKEGTLGVNLEGGKFVVKDKDGKIMQKFSAEKEGVYLNKLKEGETYTIEEIEAPDGYEIGKPVKFKVTNEKETQVIKMKDKKIPVIDVPNIPNTPKTGDPNGWIWIALLVLIGSGVTAARIVDRKKEIKKKNNK